MDPSLIYIIYGDNPKSMIKRILDEIDLDKEIPSKDSLIGIKPNLVVAKPHTSGATTCPQLVEGLVEHLKSKGYNNIAILEGSWVGDRTQLAFKVCGYENLSKKYNIPLIDYKRIVTVIMR